MTSIKCGNCKGSHDTVADVRACYGQRVGSQHPVATIGSRVDTEFAGLAAAFPAAVRSHARHEEAAVATAVADNPWGSTLLDEASEKQKAFIASLRSERGLDELAFTGSKRNASTEIKRLLALPKTQVAEKVAKALELPEVPAGRYAVEVDGVLKFYRVDRPTEGRWAGYTFVKVQASDDLHPVRGNAAKGILDRIAKDPREASLRYGREIGSCGVCGRTLTDEDSRAAGIGPICASKTGW